MESYAMPWDAVGMSSNALGGTMAKSNIVDPRRNGVVQNLGVCGAYTSLPGRELVVLHAQALDEHTYGLDVGR